MIMITSSASLAMCGPPVPWFSSDPFLIIRSLGTFGLIGWLSILAIPLGAVAVMARHLHRPTIHQHGTGYFAFAHLCFLVFLTFSILFALQWTHPGTVMIFLGIGMMVTLSAVGAVSAVLRILPRPNFWACAGLTCAGTSIALFSGMMLTVYHVLSSSH